ncbi:beta-lactoglobulin isoform X1 [Equus caballus]|uniref:beta-lactoglobulin isoform X1 n=1 Tax=Equus caballus TaxID=9796 RepID=UPI000717CC05
MSGHWRTHMTKGHQLPRLSSLWAPAVTALEKRPLLLLTLILGLASAQETLEEVPVQPAFDAQKVEGRWLTVQLASSHAHLVSPDDPLRLALHSIRSRDGDLELILFWTGEGVCKGVNVTIHPTGLQGQYQGSFEGGGSMHVRFVSTDYSNLILYVRFEDDDETTSLWALLARRMVGDPAWLGKYLEYVAEFQLQKAPVLNLDGKRCPWHFSWRPGGPGRGLEPRFPAWSPRKQ